MFISLIRTVDITPEQGMFGLAAGGRTFRMKLSFVGFLTTTRSYHVLYSV